MFNEKNFVLKIDGILLLYFIFFSLLIYFNIFNNDNIKKILLTHSKTLFFKLGLLIAFGICIYIYNYQPRNDIEKRKKNRFERAIHLGIIASFIALLDKMGIIIGQFFFISFLVYFLNSPV